MITDVIELDATHFKPRRNSADWIISKIASINTQTTVTITKLADGALQFVFTDAQEAK